MTPATAGVPRGNAGLLPWRPAGKRSAAPAVVIAVLTVMGLGLRTYLAVRPGLMSITQYDDGPYFGSAVRLAHGVLPYRDFALVQPPGITLLMSPVAVLSNLTGTAWGLAIGRLLTVAAGSASVLLAGLLVRHRGTLAVFITCGVVAVYPPSALAAHTVLLEPWAVLFCLAGAVAVFDGDRLAASTRRLAWGGAALGFAGAVKLWAAVPVAVLFLLCLPRLRRAAVFAGGAAAGFGLPVVPFFTSAPGGFYASVILAQAARNGPRVSLPRRLQEMLGVAGGPIWEQRTALLAMGGVAVFAAGSQVAATLATGRRPPRLDWFAMLTAALVVGMLLWPPYFANHYSAFLAPFLGLSVALAAARLAEAAHPAAWPRAIRALGKPLAGLAVLALAAVVVLQAPQPLAGAGPAPPAVIGQVIPPGACVLTDQASFLLLANRFTANAPGCPQMVDSLGTDLALSAGRRPGTGAARVPAVTDAWWQAFRHAEYVLLSEHSSVRIAWTQPLKRYFRGHFRLIMRKAEFTVYARVAHSRHRRAVPRPIR